MDLDEVVPLLRKRNEPVPRPLRLPTLTEVDDAERRLGVHFHSDFRRYMLECSDVTYGVLEPVTITCTESHTDLFKVADSAWTSYDVPRALLPICEDNGDFYCVSTSGEVVFWSHNGLTKEKWSGVAEWIQIV